MTGLLCKEGRIIAIRILQVGIGAGGDQDFHYFQVSLCRCMHQGRKMLLGIHLVGIRSLFKQ